MGTRSLTVMRDTWNRDEPEEVVVMYRQMDGYPTGHGRDLANFLNGMVVGNGISMNGPKKFANGMGCLAAQIIAHFKNESGVGGIYLHPAGTRDAGEEFIYYVDAGHDEQLTITVYETDWGHDKDGMFYTKQGKKLFEGTPEDFLVGLEKGVYE